MEENKNNVLMIKRTFEILDYIFDHNSKASFPEMEIELNIPKATLFRILSTLEGEELIEKNSLDEYGLGIKFVYYGEKVKSGMSLLTISKNILSELAQEIGETVNLNILYQEMLLNILSIEGEESILSSKLVPVSPLNCSSSGKLFLAHASEEFVKNYFSQNKYENRTKNSIVDITAFEKEKEKILSEGIAYDREEYEYGLNCLSMPLLDYQGLMIAGVSISAPKSRIETKDITFIISKLQKSVEAINQILKLSKL